MDDDTSSSGHPGDTRSNFETQILKIWTFPSGHLVIKKLHRIKRVVFGTSNAGKPAATFYSFLIAIDDDAFFSLKKDFFGGKTQSYKTKYPCMI